MTWTRQQYMDLAREVSQTAGSNQWSDAVVRTWCGVAHRRMWKEVLNANNGYRMATLSVTQDANGQFLKTAMDSGSGDAAQTHYRILSLCDDNQYFYRQVRYQDYPTPGAPTMQPYVWYEFGSSIQVMPVSSGTVLTVTVNWMPTRIDNLAADTSNVDWIDDYESAISFYAAGLMAMKGGNETEASQTYKAQGMEIISDMLNDLRRAGKDPTRMRSPDSADMWGG